MKHHTPDAQNKHRAGICVLLARDPRQIAGVPDDPERAHDPSPQIGRFVAAALATLFVMVALGVFWIWGHARREQDWRDQMNNSEPFSAPTNTPRPAPATP